MFLRRAQRILAVRGRQHFITLGLNAREVQMPQGGIIFDDQQAFPVRAEAARLLMDCAAASKGDPLAENKP